MNRLEECVNRHFNFLNQFGYIILKGNNADIISCKGKNNQIDVIFSSYEYYLTCEFIGGDNQKFSLNEGLWYGAIEGFKGWYQIANKDDIEKGAIYLAEAVKSLFERIDVSDPLNFQKIYQFCVEKRKESLEEYYLEIDLKKAESYWKSKEYDKAKKLFEKNIEKLSKSQLKKLEYINKKCVTRRKAWFAFWQDT